MSESICEQAPSNEPAANEQPYDWDKCTIRLSITFFPSDGSGDSRRIVLGCNTHNDPPLIEVVRESALGIWPPVIADLFERLKQRLPQRAEIAKSRREAEAAAVEKLKLQQQTKEKVRAAQQRSSHAINDHRQPSSPAPTRENIRSETLFDLSISSPTDQTDTAGPIPGKQCSLFD